MADAAIVLVKLSELQLRRPRQWGACWLALLLWRELQLDLFWCKRLGVSRKGTRWDQVLFVLVAYRLLAPGSEWRLHREWFRRSALADLQADPPFPEGDKRRFGYSRDHRPDCVQVIIALVVTPEGLPLAYEVLPGALVQIANMSRPSLRRCAEFRPKAPRSTLQGQLDLGRVDVAVQTVPSGCDASARCRRS